MFLVMNRMMRLRSMGLCGRCVVVVVSLSVFMMMLSV